jgi:hypothetical protein
MPLLCGLALRDNWRLAIGSSGAVAGAGGGNPARSSGGAGQGRAWGGPGVARGRFWEVGLGGEAAGDGRRRRTRVAAAVVRAPARWRLSERRERAGEL